MKLSDGEAAIPRPQTAPKTPAAEGALAEVPSEQQPTPEGAKAKTPIPPSTPKPVRYTRTQSVPCLLIHIVIQKRDKYMIINTA